MLSWHTIFNVKLNTFQTYGINDRRGDRQRRIRHVNVGTVLRAIHGFGKGIREEWQCRKVIWRYH
uniref:Uncharacterized protein n=1 Tax=Arundo donax TaxID=35708 RepID=A0A0A8ZTP4_ARUDO